MATLAPHAPQRSRDPADNGDVAARIIVSPVEPGEPSREVDFDARLTIGRASSNALVIDQLDCSRNHAEILLRGDGRYEIVDPGSRNGVFVNGQRITGSRDLAHGDRIEIAEVTLRFFTVQPRATSGETAGAHESHVPGALDDAAGAEPSTDAAHAKPDATQESAANLLPAVVLASDIVGYRKMLDELAPAPLRRFATEWCEESARVIAAHKGALDRMASGSVLAYWLVEHPDRPEREVALALRAAAALAALAEEFAAGFVDRFGGGSFGIGVGVHLGPVELGNAGATQEQVWTLLGDAVTIAVGLEGLAEEHGHVAVVSEAVALRADGGAACRALGTGAVREGDRPIQAFALELSAWKGRSDPRAD
jgi:class 3 adenylate cyclase